MIDPKILQKVPGENRYSYTWRIGQYLSTRKDWENATPIINEQLGTNFDESTHRKLYALSKLMWENVFSEMNDTEYSSEIRKLELELDRAKQKYRDERNELNKVNRQMARAEENMKILEKSIRSHSPIPCSNIQCNSEISDKDFIIALSDWHIGECFYNACGMFDAEIAKKRLEQYVDEIKKLQCIHKAENAYVVILGDMISGNNHVNIAITNRENIIEQIQTCSQLLAWFLAEISYLFVSVKVIDVSGNHSRITQKAEDSLTAERLDTLIPHIADSRLRWNYPFVDNVLFDFDGDCKDNDTVSSFYVRGKIFVAVHGDYDDLSSQQGLYRLQELIGYRPYGILCGHNHHFLTNYTSTRVYQCGCLSGFGNEYTIKKRFPRSNPSQMILVCTENGVISIHPVELS